MRGLVHHVLLGIAWLTLGGILFFFFWGLTDGTVSSFNMMLWFMLIGAPCAVIWGAMRLRRAGMAVAANLLLCVIAAPVLAGGVMVAALVLNPPNWH